MSLLLSFSFVIQFLPYKVQNWGREGEDWGKEAKVVLLRWQDDQTFLVCQRLMKFFRIQAFYGQTQKSSKQTGIVSHHIDLVLFALIIHSFDQQLIIILCQSHFPGVRLLALLWATAKLQFPNTVYAHWLTSSPFKSCLLLLVMLILIGLKW